MTIAAERKAKSEETCRRLFIPVNPHLPIIESEPDVKLRSLEEVVRRAMCLCIVAMKGEGMDSDQVLDIVRELELTAHLTAAERSFVFDADPGQQDRVNFSWRYESYWVLLWALGYVRELGLPIEVCDVAYAVTILADRKDEPTRFLTDATMRSVSDVLNEADLIYRMRWACVEAKLQEREIPGGLHPGVAYERHYALNWLVNYMDQDWDEVSCDT